MVCDGFVLLPRNIRMKRIEAILMWFAHGLTK